VTAYRKKLIEVALPLEAINRESAREKEPFTRHHPRSMHIWWARRPLAACRAVLFASLVDDPDSDPTFRKADGAVDEERAGYRRAELFNLIEELVKWENSNDESIFNRARSEIAASIASRKVYDTKEWTKDQVVSGEKAWSFICRIAKPQNVSSLLSEYAPPILDPFCGGGSIPLEAQRLGLRAHASDLNPVPVLITKALIEIPPKFAGKAAVNPDSHAKLKGGWAGAQGLAEDIRYYGKWMSNEAKKRIGQLYPKVKITAEMTKERPDLKPYSGETLNIIAWLWVRTIQCPNPACGCRAPLVRSFWLSTKKGRSFYANPVLDAKRGTVRFQIKTQGAPPKFTTDRKGARCLFCDRFIKKPELRDIAVRHGVTEIPLAVIAEGKRARVYLDGDSIPLKKVPRPSLTFLEQPMTNDKRWFSPPLYGLPNFADLFTNRQLTTLTTFSDLITEARKTVLVDALQASTFGSDTRTLDRGGVGPHAYADAVISYLAIALARWSDLSNTICSWNSTNQNVRALFARQAIPMSWDFVELSPFSTVAPFTSSVEAGASAIEGLSTTVAGDVKQLDARASINGVGACMISTDPPYYDNIGYADLSDFFYVWLRRSLSGVFPELFATLLTPKAQELIASPHRHGGNRDTAQQFFEQGLGAAFAKMREQQDPPFPLTVYYAFKQTEDDDSTDDAEAGTTAAISTGWETMLSGLIKAGFSVLGTWPMRTERGTRSVGLGTNALASSVVLSCRPRLAEAPLATRREFLNALKRELPDALKHLQRGNIAPVDLAQAAIGPGMAVFTRYSKVMEADGSSMPVRQALGLINQVLDEVLAEQEGEFDADTRWALAWFEQFSMDEGPFGDAETLSKAKNTAVNALQDAGIIKARSGKVRLLKRSEMKADWNPASNDRLTSWEVTQHLIRALDSDGETAAAALLRNLGGVGEVARDLAYRLYSICERKKWAEEAMAYNSLVIAWPELSRLARSAPATPPAKQTELF
jgi:putative DNA methylase